MVAARRSATMLARAGRGKRPLLTGCASPMRRPRRSRKWSCPEQSTNSWSAGSPRLAARRSAYRARTAGWSPRARFRAPRAIPNSQIEQVVDLGFVGEPASVDTSVIDTAVAAGMIPVIAPIAAGRRRRDLQHQCRYDGGRDCGCAGRGAAVPADRCGGRAGQGWHAANRSDPAAIARCARMAPSPAA